MDSYFLYSTNCNLVKLPMTFEPAEELFTACSTVINFLPFFGFFKHIFLMGTVDLYSRLFRPVLGRGGEAEICDLADRRYVGDEQNYQCGYNGNYIAAGIYGEVHGYYVFR